tara:strand:+ start:411 stop:1331 length:921 start_codon:yes stop_codon:yes gene_type:complete
MRILRLSFLKQYFILSKNIKRALLIINTGIFLSIFAATSASVSFYIEKKINEKEFLLIESQQTLRDLSDGSTTFSSIFTLYNTLMNNETSRVSASSLSSMTDFGDKVLSNKDFYLPVIFTATKEIEVFSEIINEKIILDEKDDVIKEMTLLEWLLFAIRDWTEEDIKEVETSIDEFKLTVDEIKKINISIYEETIFHSTYLDLLKEINNSDNNSINNYEHKIYKDYKTAMDLNYAAIDLLKTIGFIFGSLESTYIDEIKKLNSEISKLSDLEKNIIFIAFILQFIIFFIVQFFEISSVSREINKKK